MNNIWLCHSLCENVVYFLLYRWAFRNDQLFCKSGLCRNQTNKTFLGTLSIKNNFEFCHRCKTVPEKCNLSNTAGLKHLHTGNGTKTQERSPDDAAMTSQGAATLLQLSPI
jgi:hypothetical protein